MPVLRYLLLLLSLPMAAFAQGDQIGFDEVMPADAPTALPITAAACPALLSDPPPPLPYAELGSFQVDADGEYTLTDLGATIGLDVALFVFSAPFDPEMPQLNLELDVDTSGSALLTADQDYWLVVQRRCGGIGDRYTLMLQGPGDISTPTTDPDLPDPPRGVFDGTQPLVDLGDGLLPYATYEILTVAIPPPANTVFDASRFTGLDIKVHVYLGVFDPNDPLDGRIAVIDDVGGWPFTVGGTYTFVIQPKEAEAQGTWAMTGRQGAPFPINAGLNDAWYRVDTPGQGLFLNVFPERGEVFMGWFTYDVERPDASATAMVGEPGHRWMTGLGEFVGDTTVMQLEVTEGGLFDMPFEDELANHQSITGTLWLQVHACHRATLRYVIQTNDEQVLENEFELRRIVDSNVPLCFDLSVTEAANPSSVPAE